MRNRLRTPRDCDKMVKVLISYYRKGGKTEKTARALAEGAWEAPGAEVELL